MIFMDTDWIQILEAIGIAMAVTGPGIAAVIGYFRSKFRCIKELRDDLDELKDSLGDRQLRQSKALIILANRLDRINHDQHGKSLDLGPEVETILKDKKGNL